MTRALLNPRAAEHLRKLLAMCGSTHDGEVLNAARLADRFVRQLGITWDDVLVQPLAGWEPMAHACREQADRLTPRERDFITNIAKLRRPPTDRQLKWLQGIFERLRREEAA
jgi:hypothetical protein